MQRFKPYISNSWVLVLVILVISPETLSACPFCTASAQTLRQDMEAMDVVGLGELAGEGSLQSKSDDVSGLADFRLTSVWRGSELIGDTKVINAPYFGSSQLKSKFLIMGVGRDDLLWSSPLPVTPALERYLGDIQELSEDASERLRFYIRYLEHPESLIARDAYDEFAQTPYDDVKSIQDAMDRSQLLTWVVDPDIAPDRKRLYYTLLGVCGKPEDTALLESQMRDTRPGGRPGLDALIACYLTLKGESGLPLVEDLFLKNTKCIYSDTYAAVMALRFHGTEGGVIDREKIVVSMRMMLDRPEFADLVIPDLARWEDWSQIDKMVTLFKEADETTSWVRVPVVNFLRACPLPEAKERLKELEEIDPKAVKRASTFFPIPQPAPTKAAPGNNDSSFENRQRRRPGESRWTNSDPEIMRVALGARGRQELASASNETSSDFSWTHRRPKVDVNRWGLLGVTSLVGFTLAFAMWSVFSSSRLDREE